MQKKAQFKNGYTFNRVINGCWQLSAEHCLQGHLDYDDAIRAFHELVEQGFTTFDCADIYTGAEEVLGRFVTELKASGHYQEEDIQIHTKFVPDKERSSGDQHGVHGRNRGPLLKENAPRSSGSGTVPLVGFQCAGHDGDGL